jgi:hypothetical protein
MKLPLIKAALFVGLAALYAAEGKSWLALTWGVTAGLHIAEAILDEWGEAED